MMLSIEPMECIASGRKQFDKEARSGTISAASTWDVYLLGRFGKAGVEAKWRAEMRKRSNERRKWGSGE